MTSNILADYLQIWGMEDDFAIFADGSIGFGLGVMPKDASCWSDEKINGFIEQAGQFLNGLPEGIDVQFVQSIEKGNEQILGEHQSLSSSQASNVSQTLCVERCNRLSTLDDAGAVPKHCLRLFCRRPFSSPLLQRPRFFSRAKHFQRLSEERLKQEVTKTSQLRDNLIKSLEQVGIQSHGIGCDPLLDLVYHQWNPVRGVERPRFDPEDVRSSLLFTDLALSEKGFSLSDTHYRLLSLKNLPDSTSATMATVLRDLPFCSKVFVSIHVPNQQRELEKLKALRRIAFSLARGRTDSASDIESESKYDSLETLMEEMVAKGEKVFKVAINVLLCAQDKSELDEQANDALTKLRLLGGAEFIEETVASFEIFSQVALPNARTRERLRYLKTSNLADLLPLYGPWSGHETPRALLRTRLGSLLPIDPFSPGLTNLNQVVSGGSGAGKSFLTNILLLHTLKESPQIFVIDIGGSYKKLCEHLGGQYIPLGLTSDLTLNPFDLAPSQNKPSNEKIKFLVGLVELMTKEEDEARLPKLERAEIEEAIQKTFDAPEPRLTQLRERLLNHSQVEIRRFGRILGPWCGETPFGQFIDKKTTIELNRPVVVFDLKGMESHPDLQAVALFIITDFVWREVQKDRSEMKFLVFDECWKLLQSQAGLSFIEEVFRTFRKYRASAVAISQNIDDFAKSKIAGAILSNSATKWILMQRGADQNRLKEVLSLNDNEMTAIASLRQERGVYSEAFLITGDDRAVVAVESTPLEYWLATTDPADLAAIQTLEDEGEASEHALEKLAQQYPTGISAGKKFQQPNQKEPK